MTVIQVLMMELKVVHQVMLKTVMVLVNVIQNHGLVMATVMVKINHTVQIYYAMVMMVETALLEMMVVMMELLMMEVH